MSSRNTSPSWVARSELPDTARPGVVLLDSLGELAALYRIADIAFVGGTLVPTGGHNPLEPARFGVAIAAGPSMHNFREMSDQFDHANAWTRVSDAPGLGEVWRAWIERPDEARAVWSDVPPALNGTTSLIGFSGHAAEAAEPARASSAAPAAPRIRLPSMSSPGR